MGMHVYVYATEEAGGAEIPTPSIRVPFCYDGARFLSREAALAFVEDVERGRLCCENRASEDLWCAGNACVATRRGSQGSAEDVARDLAALRAAICRDDFGRLEVR